MGSVQCGAVQCGSVQCGAVQCGAVQCKVVQWEWGDAPSLVCDVSHCSIIKKVFYPHLIYKRLLLPNLITTDFSLMIQIKTTLQIRACSAILLNPIVSLGSQVSIGSMPEKWTLNFCLQQHV